MDNKTEMMNLLAEVYFTLGCIAAMTGNESIASLSEEVRAFYLKNLTKQ